MISATLTRAVRQAHIRTNQPPGLVVSFPRSPFNSFPSDIVLDNGMLAHVAAAPGEIPAAVSVIEASGVTAAFQLHWTSWALGAEADQTAAERRLAAALEILDSIGDLPLVWTVHNALPHECRYQHLELALRERIIDQADLIHIMNPMTPEVVAGWYELATDKLVMVPHPPAPSIDIDRPEARRRQRLDPARRYVAFLGQIRPYKGLDIMLDALDLAPTVHAIVAGAPAIDAESAAHAERAALHPRVIPHLTHLEQEQLTAIATAADAVVLPHRRILNSGIVEIARAANTPLIAPDLAHVRAIIEHGSFYAPADAPSLASALEGPLADSLSSVTPASLAGPLAALLSPSRSSTYAPKEPRDQ